MDKTLEFCKKIYEAGFVIYPTSDFCWEILPKKIKVNIKYEALTGEYYYKKELQKIFLINNFIGYPIHSIEIKNTLHEALLELICWCIDNGHIKAVKK
jgi:hypothetical protein